MKDVVKNWKKSLRLAGSPDEWESKKLLKAIGLNVEPGQRFLPGESIITDNLNFPLAVKVCDPSILHKTEQGGVELNVSPENFSMVIEKLRQKFPSSPLLAAPMSNITGPEFIVGGLVDPVFGPAVMVGSGGVLTELYRDIVFRLCPCSMGEAVRMLNELKISPVLNGYRGSILDLEALAYSVSLVSNLFDAFEGKLNQIDINPMVYNEKFWTALDCALIMD